MVSKKRIHYSCEGGIAKSGSRNHSLSSLSKQNLCLRFGASKMHKLRTPVSFEGGCFVVVDLLLFILALIVCGSLMFGSCFVMPY